MKPGFRGFDYSHPVAPRSRPGKSLVPIRPSSIAAFTLVEIMIAIGILALIMTAIFSTWTAILRSTKVGLDTAAAVQRARIAVRTIEDSLGSAQIFMRNAQYYGFVAENNSSLSFVARLAKSFPRSGKFGDFDVRRLTFSIEDGPESSRQLVLRQAPVLMEMDSDEVDHPLVLAKNVQDFDLRFWDRDARRTVGEDWPDEWLETNKLPTMVKITLKLSDSAHSRQAQEVIMRIVSIPSVAVRPEYQLSQPGPGQNQLTNGPLNNGQLNNGQLNNGQLNNGQLNNNQLQNGKGGMRLQ